MNRRGFLSSLGFGAAGLLATSGFDWERLLWRPKPIITVPAMPGKATMRVYFDGDGCHVFRNVDYVDPRDLYIPSVERKRTLGAITIEVANPLTGRSVVQEMNPLHKGLLLYPGNTLTVQLPRELVTFS